MGVVFTSWTPDRVIKRAMDKMEVKMDRAMRAVQSEVKSLLNRRGGVSAPGEPPRRHSGELYGSIEYAVIRTRNEIRGVVYTTSKKGRRLELGFAGRDSLGRLYNMRPRPYLRPGFRNSQSRVQKILGAQ